MHSEKLIDIYHNKTSDILTILVSTLLLRFSQYVTGFLVALIIGNNNTIHTLYHTYL